ncbi:LINE-1 reverse transcriptase-like [Vitis vinifera]|uniref:LINE-1 reverse transcriptase-like n=1 Tax=Vitis vinifera TaxID=29760 RepID=A0A438KJ39_VITVI|nr:LINE-1 reverse transcriptase-like [Vitis vinifera]
MEDYRKALCLARSMPQEERGWEEARWEESDLARFSQFLGFSTEGLEKDILEFLVKIRKRRERIHSKGAAGGILICWDKRTLEVLEMEMGQFSISCRLRNVEDGKAWIFTGGDFNVTLAHWERSNQGRLTGAMRRFAQVVDELELLDIPLQGGEGGGWLLGVGEGIIEFGLDWTGGGIRKGPSPLGSKICGSKLMGLRSFFEDGGRRDVFGRLEVNKNLALQQVEFWDRVESDRSLTERETELKTEAKDVFKKWVLLEETHWRQLSRELWLREGDKNTGFFHRMTNAHRRNNSMEKIKINGRWLEEEQELQRLNQAEAEGLEQPFTEEEIHAALMGMNGEKAPGLDGFTVAFWQSCWEFAKEEIVDLFKEFFEEKSFAKSLNSTFLVLIPKKGGAEDLGTSSQLVCLGGRQILDASLIANEVIDYWVKRKEKGLICKLDIEKAYDSINWNFLMKVMDKMGFGDRWMKWIWWCISTARFSILVNGVPAGYFPNSRGLRQGDPLSPYLFVLGMEVLSALLRRAVDGGFISGCRLRGRGGMEMNVSHLLFADDTIIFCEARQDHLTYLSWILVWFEAAFGLKINLAKSEVIPVGEVEDIDELAVELGCKVGALPSVYLGLPLGAKHKTTAMWDGVEARMRRRLALWKKQYLSKGGRITLIKSTLASMPIYQLSLFRMPKLVAKRLEKLQRDFLWGGGSLERKIHLINWEVVCSQKERGGLGDWGEVWHVGFGWRTKEACGTFEVGVWRDILKELYWCWDNIEFKVGKGTKVSFWTDHWCGNEALSQAFPQLFALAAQMNASELDALRELLHLLRDLRISHEEDSVIWKEGGHGRFRIRDAYKLLTGPNVITFPKKSIWVDKVPSKVAFFAWEASWEKVLTLDRLQRRGWHLPNRESQRDVSQLEGPFCGEKEENDLDFHSVVYFLDGMEGEK